MRIQSTRVADRRASGKEETNEGDGVEDALDDHHRCIRQPRNVSGAAALELTEEAAVEPAAQHRPGYGQENGTTRLTARRCPGRIQEQPACDEIIDIAGNRVKVGLPSHHFEQREHHSHGIRSTQLESHRTSSHLRNLLGSDPSLRHMAVPQALTIGAGTFAIANSALPLTGPFNSIKISRKRWLLALIAVSVAPGGTKKTLPGCTG